MGVSLEDIRAEFRISHRTAQRMTEALETVFSTVVHTDTEDRKRRWRLEAPLPDALQPHQETAVEALEIAIREAYEQARLRHARALEDVRDRLLTRLTPRDARRSEADAEAILASLGKVMRPGPTVSLRPEITEAIIEALRGPFRVRMIYGTPEASPRIVEPYGLLLGHRSYLVARQPARGAAILNFRMDRIHRMDVLDESFVFADGFTLKDYASQAFGVYQNPQQYGEVVWRFAPEAAKRAGAFCFHPTQVLEAEEDGSLIVRFNAAGWLEMAWHLYQWGDKVEVLAPEGLRALVEGYQRPDFDALP